MATGSPLYPIRNALISLHFLSAFQHIGNFYPYFLGDMIEWKLEKRLLKDLIPHPKNPRMLSSHDAEHLQKSMDKFGLIDKPILNLDNMIIGGHQRVTLLKKTKVKSVECWIPSRLVEEKEVDELLLRLNRNHGDFDHDVLANNFDLSDLSDWGFTDLDLDFHSEDPEISSDPKTDKKEKTCPSCGCPL